MRVADYEARFVITPDAQYRRMASEAVYTLARASRDSRPVVLERRRMLDDDRFGFSVMPVALSNTPLRGPALLCDADVHFVRDPVDMLGRTWHWDVAARPATSVIKRDDANAAWNTVKQRMDVDPGAPLLNDGVVFLQAHAAKDLSARWVEYMEDVQAACSDVLSDQAGPRPGRYFWTMYAFSIWAANMELRGLEPCEVSFAWDGDQPGGIVHWGTRYWQSLLKD